MRNVTGLITTGLLLTLAGCALDFANPASRSVAISGAGASAALPVLNLAPATADAGAQAPVTITLSGPSTQPVTFTYTTSSGTAQSGTDFTGESGTVTIPAGSTAATIPVSTSSGGAGKTFTVTVSAITGAQSGTTSSTVSIASVPACTGAFTPILTQLGGGFRTAGNGLIHDTVTSCLTWVAGTNQLSATGTGTIPLATEYGGGGAGATSVVLSQFDYQGELMWTSEYAFPNAVAHVAGLVRDGSGNFYVGGYVSCAPGQTCSFGGTPTGSLASGLTANGNSNAFILKFNSLGSYQQTYQLKGGAAASGVPSIVINGVALDALGNIDLAGSNTNLLGGPLNGALGKADAFVASFTPSGTLNWTSELGDEACSSTAGVCTDGSPAAYAADAVVVDSAGNIDVAGQAQGALWGDQQYLLSPWAHGLTDVFAAQFTSGGSNNWAAQYSAVSSAWASGIRTDSSNNVYVTGYTEGVMGTTGDSYDWTQYGAHGERDLFWLKVDSNGNAQQVTQYGKLGASLTVAPTNGNSLGATSSNFYLMAQTDTYLGGGCYFGCGVSLDTLLVQISSSGAFNGWFTEIGPVDAATPSPFALTTDGNGNSYLASLVDSAIGAQYGVHGTDTLLATVSATGQMSAPASTPPAASANPLWPIQQGGGGSTATQAFAVAQDSAGNSYAAGATSASLTGATQLGAVGGTDATASKFSAAGGLQWTTQLGTNIGTDTTHGQGIALDSQSNVYLAGDTTGTGLIHGGTQLGTRGSCDLFISSFASGSGAQGSLAVQYGQSGATISVNGLARDAAGDLYVVGDINQRFTGSVLHGSVGSTDLFVAKFTATGTLSWSAEIGGGGSNEVYGEGIVLDGSGNVDVVGTTSTSIGTAFGNGYDSWLLVAQFSVSSGSMVWAASLGAPGQNDSTIGAAITLDRSGNLIVTGNTDSANAFPTGSQGGGQQYGYAGSPYLVLASFAPGGGASALNWANELGAYMPCFGGEACSGFIQAATYGTGVAVDANGNLVVAGYTNGVVPGETQYRAHAGANTGSSYDALVAEFTPAGAYEWTSQLGYTQAETQALAIAPGAVGGGSTAVIAGFTGAFLGGTENGALGASDLFILRTTATGVLP